MGAFEVNETTVEPMFVEQAEVTEAHPCASKPVKDECLIAQKVYDSCRRQNCLTEKELGPALSASEDPSLAPAAADDAAGLAINGNKIVPPDDAVSVTMGPVSVKSIQVLGKQLNQFKPGYWDIDIKYDMVYDLTFRNSNGNETVFPGLSVFEARTSLFGSHSNEIAMVTDMYESSSAPTLTTAPFTWVEAKTMGLESRIMQAASGDREVHVTIGLFSIIKLFRLVHLNVQSKGFCIPKECVGSNNINPCKYFGDLDFPMDVFVPPQSKEFHAGVSENIRKH